MKCKSVYLIKLIFTTNIVFALLLLFSYLTPIINPQQFWPLAFIGLAYPFLVITNFVYIFIWLIVKWKYALLSGAAILLGWGVILNYFGFNFKTKQNLRTANSLRVMTYNVHDFQTNDPSNSLSYQKILNLIKLQNPDIITFEEFCSRNAKFRFCDSLTKALNSSHYYFEPFIKAQNDSTGLAIFSKFPIINRNIIKLSDEENDNQGISVDIKFKKKTLRIYCFHLESIKLNRWDFLFLKKNTLLNKQSLHDFFSKIKSAYIIRAQQAVLIKKQANQSPYPYIFTGDFNDTPNSYTVRQMTSGLKNAFKEKGWGLGTTYNFGFSIFQIDYILTSPEYNIDSYQIIKQKISDHYPVYADLSVR